MVACAVQAVRAGRLLHSALWLAGVSVLLAMVLYEIGAPEVAVVELSVGAGLVTVLLIYGIAVAGDEPAGTLVLVPRPVAGGAAGLAALLLAWMILPARGAAVPETGEAFRRVLWQARGLDVLVQIVLIFGGILGVLGLLRGRTIPEGPPHVSAAARPRELEHAQPPAGGSV